MNPRVAFIRRLMDGIATRARLDVMAAETRCPELPQARLAREARRRETTPQIEIRLVNDTAVEPAPPRAYLH